MGGWEVYPLLFFFIKCTKVWIIQLSSTGSWKDSVVKKGKKKKSCLLLALQLTGVNQWETLEMELLHHTIGLSSEGYKTNFKA